ncbi:MAG: HAD family hydrolase [Sulfobacillus sp.]
MTNLVIFDIDGTLLNAKGAGRRALEDAFATYHGIADAFSGVSFAGETDLALIQQAAQRHQLPMSDQDWLALKELFLTNLQIELDKAPGYVMPGLPDILFRLQYEGLYLALGTGNFKATGYLKLAQFGLAGFFPVGGFGESGPSRRDVIAGAIKAATSHYHISPDRITLIGDTPLDIDAARFNHIRSIGVASGPYSLDDLAKHHPEILLPDLSDETRILDALTS